MAKKKRLSHDQRIINALEKIQSPIFDKRHNLSIYFINDRVRSNETRFEHISKTSHELQVHDLERIPRQLNNIKTTFKPDKKHKDTVNYYIQRFGYTDLIFIKMSVLVDEHNPKMGKVKTIFITDNKK